MLILWFTNSMAPGHKRFAKYLSITHRLECARRVNAAKALVPGCVCARARVSLLFKCPHMGKLLKNPPRYNCDTFWSKWSEMSCRSCRPPHVQPPYVHINQKVGLMIIMAWLNWRTEVIKKWLLVKKKQNNKISRHMPLRMGLMSNNMLSPT